MTTTREWKTPPVRMNADPKQGYPQNHLWCPCDYAAVPVIVGEHLCKCDWTIQVSQEDVDFVKGMND